MNTEFEINPFYCLSLDDYSTPSFCSFEKNYFGDIAQIASLINFLKSDKRHSDNQTQLIQAFKEYLSGNTEIAHNVAYKNVQLLEPVYVYAQADSISDFNKHEHLNVKFLCNSPYCYESLQVAQGSEAVC